MGFSFELQLLANLLIIYIAHISNLHFYLNFFHVFWDMGAVLGLVLCRRLCFGFGQLSEFGLDLQLWLLVTVSDQRMFKASLESRKTKRKMLYCV